MSTATVPKRAANGTPPQADPLPVDTFQQAAPHLRRPFTPQAVKFKVQASWQSGALIVAYIDARLVVERLNLVCPHLWTDETYEPLGKSLQCTLTIDGITRRDIGSDYIGKGLYSDALKRAAVKFGIGVSLYAIPSMKLNNGPYLNRSGKAIVLTDAGEKHLRAKYAAWLEQHGIAAFGQPLDHGDVEDAAGDAELEAPAAVEPEAEVVGIDRDRAKRIVEWSADLGRLDKLPLAVGAVAGRDVIGDADPETAIGLLADGLTDAQASRLEARLAEVEAEQSEAVSS